jgi:hypothetical protein
MGKSDRDRIYYKIQFIRRNEHFLNCYEGIKSLLIPDEHGELKKITKDKRLIARAKSLYNEFSKKLDEFYPFDLDDLMSMMKAHPKGKWTVPSYYLPSILVLFCDEKTEKKIPVYSRFYFERSPVMLNQILEERKSRRGRISENSKKPGLLAIDAVNKKNKTIMVKIRLDRTREDILEDIERLLTLLKKEAKILGIDMERKVKLHWDEIEKYIKVYDLKKQNPQITWDEVAKQIFPGEDDWNKKFTKQLATQGAKDKVRHYYRQAIKMINGGWREI